MNQAKTCYTCKQSKPLTDFAIVKRHRDGRAYQCKECKNKADRRFRIDNAEREPSMEPKRCTECYTTKASSEFHRNRRALNGLASRCKACQSIRDRKAHNRNKPKANKRARQWRRANSEIVARYNREYYASRQEYMTARARAWYRENREQAFANAATYRARRRNAEGAFTDEDVRDIYESQNGLCVYHILNPNCKGNLAHSFHRDHIIPISRDGTNWPDNIQLLCGHCNDSKRQKNHEEYLAWLALVYP